MGKEILSKKQITFLRILKNDIALTKTIYLTGGTALAAFYLHHRKSEDLDFFSEHDIDPLAVEVFLKRHKVALGYRTFEFQKSFNRNLYFLHFAGGMLKTEFTYFPFSSLEKGMREENLRVDSLKDIAVNKVFTIAQQARARDFVDLFYILQHSPWQLRDLLKDARIKFDTHIDLIHFGAQLLKVRELKDMPKILVPFDQDAFAMFFLRKAASFKKDILK